MPSTEKIRFGPAGVPTVCKGGSLEGVQTTHDLGLGAMELEFVHGARMKLELAREIGQKAKTLGISLSAHGPYYINLLSEKPETRVASVERILQTARILHAAGGGRAVYHPAFYGKNTPQAAGKEMLRVHRELIAKVKEEKLSNVVLAPETSGRRAQWGELNELLAVCAEFDTNDINPTLDFSHLHCRSGQGVLYRKEDFGGLLDGVEKALGKKAVQTLHIHFQSVLWGDGGERSHLPIEKKEPPFEPLAQVLVEQGYGGTIICESPLIEADALALQKIYRQALKR